MHLRPVRHVRVVAGVLHNEAGCRVIRELLAVQAEPGALPSGKDDLRLLDGAPVPEHERRSLGSRRRAGAGCVTVSQRGSTEARKRGRFFPFRSSDLQIFRAQNLSPAMIDSALTTAAATFDPPLRPRLVMNGIPSSSPSWTSRSLLSAAPTKPTGRATTR